MIRNLKVLGIAIGAVFAMSAMMATVASAGFYGEKHHAFLSVSSNEVQTFNIKKNSSNEVSCTTVEAHSTVETDENTTAESVTAEPTYSDCHSFLGQTVTVDTNECHYLFTIEESETTGDVHVECGEGEGIEINIGSICQYTIGSQEVSDVDYNNVGEGSTREIEIDPTVEGITSTRTTNHFFCPGASTEGTYEGKLTVTGEDSEENHVGLFVK